MIYSPLLVLEMILPETKSKRSYSELCNKRLFLAPAGKNIRSYVDTREHFTFHPYNPTIGLCL